MKPCLPTEGDFAPGAEWLQRVRIVLHRTTHPGNIGATARAMKTMGLQRLYLSAPRTLIDSAARAMASGALDVLAAAKVCETLEGALSECSHVFAFSARPRDFSPTPADARGAAQIAIAKAASGGEVALLFGGEQSGLSNEDMRLAGYAVNIPSSSAYWSLNLAQAVQIAAYELRLASMEKGAADKKNDAAGSGADNMKGRKYPPPTRSELESLLIHCDEFLSDIGMPKRGGVLMRARLQRLLFRAELDTSEVRMLRGILTAARKKTAGK